MVKYILKLFRFGLLLSLAASIIGFIASFFINTTRVTCITYANFILFLILLGYIFLAGLGANQGRAQRAGNFYYTQGGYWDSKLELDDMNKTLSNSLVAFIVSLVPLLVSFILYKLFFGFSL